MCLLLKGALSMDVRKTNATDDFEAIGNIYASSWKFAYKGIVPQDYLDNLQGTRWSSVLPTSPYDSFVVLENGVYIGTSSVCSSRDEKMSGWGEIASLYLLPEYFGKGYGKPLFECAVNSLRERGFDNVFLWVLEENVRAQRFYEKNGFNKAEDTMNMNIGGKDLIEVRYIKQF